MAVGCGALVACATEADDSNQTLGGPDLVAGSGGSAGATGAAGTTSGSATGGASSSAGGSASGGGGSTAGGTAAGGAGSGAGGGGGASGAAGTATGGGGTGGASGNDACPDDPDKMAPGKCGCGVPDEDGAVLAGCGALQDSLVHRYGFETNANDSVGTAHGTLMGGATVSGGALVLAGGDTGQYLNLPNALISTLSNATIEAYVTWTGAAGGDWQRIFDFGNSTAGEDKLGDGAQYLFLSARKFRACYTSATPKAEVFTESSAPLPTTPVQVAVVVNGTAKSLSLYLDGDYQGGTVLSLPLSAISDVNNWLGRSQYQNDEYFAGKIHEFRIYDAALTGPQLKTSKAMGENSTYLEKQ